MDVDCLMAGFVTSFSLLHAFRYLVGSLWLCRELRRDLGYVFNGSFVWCTIVSGYMGVASQAWMATSSLIDVHVDIDMFQPSNNC